MRAPSRSPVPSFPLWTAPAILAVILYVEIYTRVTEWLDDRRRARDEEDGRG